MKLTLIAAVASNGVIGAGNDLVWRDPQDQRHLALTTKGHAVVMGRKTWQSLPEKFRPLPGRRNVVISRDAGFVAAAAECVTSLEAALALLADVPQVFVLGGGEIYAAALPLADELVLTEIGQANASAASEISTTMQDLSRLAEETKAKVAQFKTAEDDADGMRAAATR